MTDKYLLRFSSQYFRQLFNQISIQRIKFSIYLIVISVLLSIPNHASADEIREPLAEIPKSMIFTLTDQVADIKVDSIYFDSGSNLLSKKDIDKLKALGKKLSNLRIYVLIEAYTDSTGSEEENFNLSQKRAEETGLILQKSSGLFPEQFILVGRGEISQKNNRKNAMDRRVQIQILRPKTDNNSTSEIVETLRARGVSMSAFDEPGEKLIPSSIGSSDTDSNRQFASISIRNSVPIGVQRDLDSRFSLSAQYSIEDFYRELTLSLRGEQRSYSGRSADFFRYITNYMLVAGVSKNYYKNKIVTVSAGLDFSIGYSTTEELGTKTPSTDSEVFDFGSEFIAGIGGNLTLLTKAPKIDYMPRLAIDVGISNFVLEFSIYVGMAKKL